MKTERAFMIDRFLKWGSAQMDGDKPSKPSARPLGAASINDGPLSSNEMTGDALNILVDWTESTPGS